MQLTPPGTPLAQVTGGTAIALSSPPANAVDASKANISPATKMEDILRMCLILPWPRILRERPMGPRTFGCNSYEPADTYRERQTPAFLQRSTQHQPLDLARLAGLLIAINHYRAQPHIACGWLKAHRHAVEKLAHHQLFLHADDPVIRPSHADVGDVCRPLGQNSFVRCGHMGMRSDYGRHAAIQIPAQGNFL